MGGSGCVSPPTCQSGPSSSSSGCSTATEDFDCGAGCTWIPSYQGAPGHLGKCVADRTGLSSSSATSPESSSSDTSPEASSSTQSHSHSTTTDDGRPCGKLGSCGQECCQYC